MTPRRKCLLMALAAVVAVVSVSWWRHRQYELQFVGRWVDLDGFPGSFNYCLFDDGGGYWDGENSNVLRWWCSGDRLYVQYRTGHASAEFLGRLDAGWLTRWVMSPDDYPPVTAYRVLEQPGGGFRLMDHDLTQGLRIPFAQRDRERWLTIEAEFEEMISEQLEYDRQQQAAE